MRWFFPATNNLHKCLQSRISAVAVAVLLLGALPLVSAAQAGGGAGAGRSGGAGSRGTAPGSGTAPPPGTTAPPAGSSGSPAPGSATPGTTVPGTAIPGTTAPATVSPGTPQGAGPASGAPSGAGPSAAPPGTAAPGNGGQRGTAPNTPGGNTLPGAPGVPQPAGTGSGGSLGLPAPPTRLGGIPNPIPPGALTLQQVVDLARARNPTILAAQQNLLSVKAQEIQAGVRQNPYFTLNGSDLTEAEYFNNPYGLTAGVGRLFERGEKRRWRLDSARSTTVQTGAQLQQTIEQTILNVRQAFTNFIVAKSAKQLADDNLADFRREVTIGNERYKAGDLAKLDFERLDLQLAQFESDQSNAIMAAQQASDQLQVLIGYDRPHTDFDIVGDVIPPLLPYSMADLEQKGLASRPDLKAAQAAVAVAVANIRLAYANGTADPTVEADYNRVGTENSVGFVFNVPLRLFDRNQGNKKTAEFTAESNRFTVIAARNQVISDVDQAYSGYINSKLLAERYNGHYLDEARDVLDIARFSYEHGGLALIDYLDALRDARSVNSDALNAYQQTWMSIHQLSFVTATELVP